MDTRQDDSTAPVNTSEYIIPYSDVKINTNEEDIIMSTQTIKAEIINNVLVAMSLYIMEQQTLTILQNVMQQELVRVNMEEITTLPVERKNDISAIFVTSDTMAIGVAKAIVESGLTIGEDISLVGFDGMDVSQFYNPGITTVKQPRQEIAEESINLLLNILNNNESHKNLILDTELVTRESCVKRK